MIAALFPDASRRMRAFAVLAFVGSAGASIGVVAGGLLTELAPRVGSSSSTCR